MKHRAFVVYQIYVMLLPFSVCFEHSLLDNGHELVRFLAVQEERRVVVQKTLRRFWLVRWESWVGDVFEQFPVGDQLSRR